MVYHFSTFIFLGKGPAQFDDLPDHLHGLNSLWSNTILPKSNIRRKFYILIPPCCSLESLNRNSGFRYFFFLGHSQCTLTETVAQGLPPLPKFRWAVTGNRSMAKIMKAWRDAALQTSMVSFSPKFILAAELK